MWQKYHNAYSCDNCLKIIPKSQPVRFADGRHFCKPECYRAYLDQKEEDQRSDEAFEHIAVLGDD